MLTLMLMKNCPPAPGAHSIRVASLIIRSHHSMSFVHHSVSFVHHSVSSMCGPIQENKHAFVPLAPNAQKEQGGNFNQASLSKVPAVSASKNSYYNRLFIFLLSKSQKRYTLVSPHDLHFLRLHGLVPAPTSHPGDAHESGRLVHGRVVDLFAAKRGLARFALAKDGGGIAPKVLTVGHAAPAEWILLLALVLGRGGAAAGNGLDEGIDAKELAPLLEESALVLVAVAVASMSTSRRRRGRERRVVGIERSAGGCKGSGQGGVGADARHVLVRGHGAGDLDELRKHQHRHPRQLKGCPDGKEERVRVRIDESAGAGSKERAAL